MMLYMYLSINTPRR